MPTSWLTFLFCAVVPTCLQNLEIHANYISGTLPPELDLLDNLVQVLWTPALAQG